MALMERLILVPQTPHWLSSFGSVGYWLSLWRLLKRSVGLPATSEEAVLADLIVALKEASEVALRTRINTAAIAAPRMAAWQDVIPVDSTVNNALVLAGLEPYDWEASTPPYLAEVNAVLASNGRRICRERWCFLDDDSGIESRVRQIAYYIRLVSSIGRITLYFSVAKWLTHRSFTNRSLYTSLRPARCFFHYAWEEDIGSIKADFGLDKLNEATTPVLFWNGVQKLLLSRVTAYAKRHPAFSHLPFLILVAGEAADTPEFLAVVQNVVKGIPDACAVKPSQGTSKKDVELAVSDDPTFSAARGAAFWLRMRMDWSYCAESDDFDGTQIMLQETPISDGHVEL